MAKSRVIVPRDNKMDYDYIAFSFREKHSYEDMKILRTSDGDRYNEELMPTTQDTTAEVSGGDGMYYFDTRHKQRVFNISFAFEGLTDIDIRNLKGWLNTKETGDLWFAENPYKVYTAKVTGQPSIKFIPMDKINKSGQLERIYNGEGTVQFTCYWPYAHTPDYVYKWNGESLSEVGDGKVFSSYADFINEEYWEIASGLEEPSGALLNPGDIPAPFVVEKTGSLASSTVLTVGDTSITLQETVKDLIWDSKTGMVSGLVGSDRKPVNFTGNSCGAIPVGGIANSAIDIKGGTIKYHYWYY